MNAKERLRLYLEQRRDFGETELTLDTLPVDEVLRMLGAPLQRESLPRESAPKEPVQRESVTPMPSPREPAPRAPTPERAPDNLANENATDWRTLLRPPQQTPATTAPTRLPVPLPSPLPEWLARLEIPIGLSVASGSVATAQDPGRRIALASLATIEAIATAVSTCRLCPLGATARNPVPGEGNLNADFVCVGEAPGAEEDETGRPFVGASGQLLTKILAAIKLERSDVFICNVLKHRPPSNRDPVPDEVRACAPYLLRQLELLQPKVILALGKFAAQALLETTTSVGRLRGQVHRFHGIPLIVTYHPSALLRNESWKRPAWDDVRLARRILDAARDIPA